MHCTVCVCARSAPKIVQNALVLLRNIIGIIKTHIHDNHIEFEVSGRFGGVWPTVRRPYTYFFTQILSRHISLTLQVFSVVLPQSTAPTVKGLFKSRSCGQNEFNFNFVVWNRLQVKKK